MFPSLSSLHVRCSRTDHWLSPLCWLGAYGFLQAEKQLHSAQLSQPSLPCTKGSWLPWVGNSPGVRQRDAAPWRHSVLHVHGWFSLSKFQIWLRSCWDDGFFLHMGALWSCPVLGKGIQGTPPFTSPVERCFHSLALWVPLGLLAPPWGIKCSACHQGYLSLTC